MRFYIIAGYLFTAVFGTLSHFLYDCSGQNLFIALFAPVNEFYMGAYETFVFPGAFICIFSVLYPTAGKRISYAP